MLAVLALTACYPATPRVVSSYSPTTYSYSLQTIARDGAQTYEIRALPITPPPSVAKVPIATKTATPLAATTTVNTGSVVVAAAVYTGDVVSLICSYDWPCGEAVAVATCESQLQPWANNGNTFIGLFQIWTGNAPSANLFDAAVNVRVAYTLWQRNGWAPWQCRP